MCAHHKLKGCSYLLSALSKTRAAGLRVLLFAILIIKKKKKIFPLYYNTPLDITQTIRAANLLIMLV
jgi:hypothetical protein